MPYNAYQPKQSAAPRLPTALERGVAAQARKSQQSKGFAAARAKEGQAYGAVMGNPYGPNKGFEAAARENPGLDMTTFLSATMPQGSDLRGVDFNAVAGPQTALIPQADQQAMMAQNQQMNAQNSSRLLQRMGYNPSYRQAVENDPRRMGMSDPMLDYYQPGHPQYEQALQRMQGLQQGWNPYTNQQDYRALTPADPLGGNRLLRQLLQ